MVLMMLPVLELEVVLERFSNSEAQAAEVAEEAERPAYLPMSFLAFSD